ncbi:DNA ligase I [Macrolepiota fuliginosa MF-IS2]|uniref:DNA ligase n=1 Tax=Macrolepiota fuliginosa MF-IS2 TaxID=1400762 RepID=A0A9P6C9C2_9AGAR|nr:DNA ligase I [Macrolepiota fuliginosa MF-IS2]
MFTSRVLLIRGSSTLMGRQQTLAKFFEMPKGLKPAPPQQSSLLEMWKGGKRKASKREEKDEDTMLVEPKEEQKDETAMDVDAKKVVKTRDEEKPGESSKRKQAKYGPPASKKRRIIESDEDEPALSLAQAINSSIAGSSPPVSRAPSPRSSHSPEPKGKGKQKTKAPVVVESTKATSELAAATSEPSDDDGEDEVVNDELEDDDEGTAAGEGVAASKAAEAALSRLKEVDIPGGWKVGQPVPYAALARTFAFIEGTTKRLEKTAYLTSFLLLVIRRSVKDDYNSLLQTVYLCINRLSPDYEGIELGIGESLLMKAIAESTGRSQAVIKADLKREGDLGLVAMNSKGSQKTLFKPKPLTLPFVFSHLKEIATTAGHSSQAKKVSIITKLLAACQDVEAKYIIRSLEGKLRIGNAERSVLVAVAHAVVLAEEEKSTKRWSKEKLAKRLEEATLTTKSVYSELPTYDKVIPALLEVGIDGLREKCKLTPGVPLKPMLAKPTKAIGEVLDRFENQHFTCEYKYDGERAQVHKLENGTVRVFSRNSEDMSKKYPDLVDQLPKCIKESTKSFVLDAEAVAIDRKTLQLMPFQELSRRKRKDVKVEDIQVRVCLFAFDLLYLNGEPLLQRPLSERRKLLREHFQPIQGEFDFAKASDAESTEEIQTFLEESVKDGCEGLMVKMLDSEASFYEPSRRSVNWLKLKKDYLAGVGDSLDLVVVGGYYGKGKRTNVYGAFLLACYDQDSEEYQTICKIGTGFSDEMLQAHYEELKPLEMEKVRGDVKVGGAKPDVWFEPKVVWEVLTADLSLSPIYTAAHGLIGERGISLRFPRFIRVRDDKNADDATGPEQIAEMYERQALAQKSGKKKGGDDDGFW